MNHKLCPNSVGVTFLVYLLLIIFKFIFPFPFPSKLLGYTTFETNFVSDSFKIIEFYLCEGKKEDLF